MINDFYTENNVLFCRALSDIPFIAHGFSTRNGGVSALEHTKSLNLAYGRGDDDMTVNENREWVEIPLPDKIESGTMLYITFKKIA